MDILSIVGSIFSTAGGIYSWFQYKKARTAAQEAQAAKEEILQRQQLSEIETAMVLARDAENILIARTSKRTTNQGKNIAIEYKIIQKFISSVNEIFGSFNKTERTNPLEIPLKRMKAAIKDYTDENHDLRTTASNLLDETRSVIAILKKEKNLKQFSK